MFSLQTALLLLSSSVILASWMLWSPHPNSKKIDNPDETLTKMALYLESHPNLANSQKSTQQERAKQTLTTISSPLPQFSANDFFDIILNQDGGANEKASIDSPENYKKLIQLMKEQPEKIAHEIQNALLTLKSDQYDERFYLLEIARRASEIEPTDSLREILLSQAKFYQYPEDKTQFLFKSKALQYYLNAESNPITRQERIHQIMPEIEFRSPETNLYQ